MAREQEVNPDGRMMDDGRGGFVIFLRALNAVAKVRLATGFKFQNQPGIQRFIHSFDFSVNGSIGE